MRKSKQTKMVIKIAVFLLAVLGILLVNKTIITAYIPLHDRFFELILIAGFVIVNHNIFILDRFSALDFDSITIRLLHGMEILVALIGLAMTVTKSFLIVSTTDATITWLDSLSVSYLLVVIPGLYVQFHGILKALVRKWAEEKGAEEDKVNDF